MMMMMMMMILFKMLLFDTFNITFIRHSFQFRVFKIPIKCGSTVFCLLMEHDLLCFARLPPVTVGLGCILTFLAPNYSPNCPAQHKTRYAAPHCQLYR